MPIKFNHVILNRPGEQSPPRLSSFSTFILNENIREEHFNRGDDEDDDPKSSWWLFFSFLFFSFFRGERERQKRKAVDLFLCIESATVVAFSRDCHVHYF